METIKFLILYSEYYLITPGMHFFTLLINFVLKKNLDGINQRVNLRSGS